METTSPSTGTEFRWLSAVKRTCARRPGRTISISWGDTIVEIDTSGASDYVRVATLQSVTATELIADNWIFS